MWRSFVTELSMVKNNKSEQKKCYYYLLAAKILYSQHNKSKKHKQILMWSTYNLHTRGFFFFISVVLLLFLTYFYVYILTFFYVAVVKDEDFAVLSLVIERKTIGKVRKKGSITFKHAFRWMKIYHIRPIIFSQIIFYIC